MSRLLGGQRDATGFNPLALIGQFRRGAGKGASGTVSGDDALRLSVAWACRRLRADLVSTMPIGVYVNISGTDTPFSRDKPDIFVTPGGAHCRWIEWLYATQIDLDTYGNAFGVIEATGADGKPTRIRLLNAGSVSVRIETQDDGTQRIKYRAGTRTYDEADIWHEKQYPVAGSAVGLSPLAYAALTMQTTLSAAEFAASWFNGHATPAAHLRNTARTLDKGEAIRTKNRYLAQVSEGDVFVSGSDWEFNMLSAKASESMFIEQQNVGNGDLCRYFGVPGDMVDVHVDSSTVTYANVTQRNLQFLIMNLNPVLIRREDAFTYFWLGEKRYAKFNRGALLQMDPMTQAQTLAQRITSRTITPSEAREFYELPPLTDDDFAEFTKAFPPKASTPTEQQVPGKVTS